MSFSKNIGASLTSGVTKVFSTTEGTFVTLKSDESTVVRGYNIAGGDTTKIIDHTGSNTVRDITNIYSGPSYFVGVRADGTYIS